MSLMWSRMSAKRQAPRVAARLLHSSQVRIVSTAAAPAFMEDAKEAKAVRARYVEASGATVDVGFTDGSEFRFPASWMRSVIAGPDFDEVPSTAATAEMLDGSTAVSVAWGGEDEIASSTFDANMLRSYADKVALPLEGVDAANPVLGATPFKGPSVWEGKDLLASAWWGLELTAADIADLKAATKHAMEHHVEWRVREMAVPEPLAKAQFPLGDVMAKKLQGLSDEIEFGKGLAMIRNMPVPKLDPTMTEEDLAVMYMGVSGHIGNVVMQSSSGLRSVSRGYGLPFRPR